MMRLLRLFGENHRLNLLNRPTTGRFHALSRGLQENRTVASGALPSSDREAGYACAIFLRLMPFHRHVDAGDRERLALHSCGVAFKLSNRFFGALGKYLELNENNHAFLADLLQKAEEAGEDGVVGVSKTVADRYDRLFMKAYGRIGRGYRKEPEGWCFDVH